MGRDGGETVAAAAAACQAAELRAGDAFATLLNEYGPKQLPISTWSDLVVTGAQIRVAGEAMAALHPAQTLAPGAAGQLDQAIADLEQAILRTGAAIGGNARPAPAVPAPQASAPDVLALVLSRWRGSPTAASDVAVHDVVVMAWIAAWITHLRRMLDGLGGALAQIRTLDRRSGIAAAREPSASDARAAVR